MLLPNARQTSEVDWQSVLGCQAEDHHALKYPPYMEVIVASKFGSTSTFFRTYYYEEQTDRGYCRREDQTSTERADHPYTSRLRNIGRAEWECTFLVTTRLVPVSVLLFQHHPL